MKRANMGLRLGSAVICIGIALAAPAQAGPLKLSSGSGVRVPGHPTVTNPVSPQRLMARVMAGQGASEASSAGGCGSSKDRKIRRALPWGPCVYRDKNTRLGED